MFMNPLSEGADDSTVALLSLQCRQACRGHTPTVLVFLSACVGGISNGITGDTFYLWCAAGTYSQPHPVCTRLQAWPVGGVGLAWCAGPFIGALQIVFLLVTLVSEQLCGYLFWHS